MNRYVKSKFLAIIMVLSFLCTTFPILPTTTVNAAEAVIANVFTDSVQNGISYSFGTGYAQAVDTSKFFDGSASWRMDFGSAGWGGSEIKRNDTALIDISTTKETASIRFYVYMTTLQSIKLNITGKNASDVVIQKSVSLANKITASDLNKWVKIDIPLSSVDVNITKLQMFGFQPNALFTGSVWLDGLSIINTSAPQSEVVRNVFTDSVQAGSAFGWNGVSAAPDTSKFHAGASSLKIDHVGNTGWAGAGVSQNTPIDVSTISSTALIKFYANVPEAHKIRVVLKTKNSSGVESEVKNSSGTTIYYDAEVTAGEVNTWKAFSIPVSLYGTVPNISAFMFLSVDYPTTYKGAVWIDDLSVINPITDPTPSPSITPSIAPSASPSIAPSPTPSTDPLALTTIVSATDETKSRPLGRAFVEDGKRRLHWSLSGLEFTVANTSKVELELSGANSYIGVIIDDAATYQRMKITNSTAAYVTIAQFNSAESHKIKVVKLSEAMLNSIAISNIKLSGTKNLQPTIRASKAKTKKVEFVGDSLTAGYGVLGGSGLNVDYEDAWKAYPGYVAKYFGADVSEVSASGKGLLVDPTNKIPDLYKSVDFSSRPASRDWDFNKFTADVVVVNIGTNDAGTYTKDDAGKALLKQAYKDFITQIRASYTNKSMPIIMSVGPMNFAPYTQITAAVSELKTAGDNNVYAFNCILSPTGGWETLLGGDGHPDASQQQRMGDKYIAKILEVMPSWQQSVPTDANVNVTLGTQTSSTNTLTVPVNFVSNTELTYTLVSAIYDRSNKLQKVMLSQVDLGVQANFNIAFDTTLLPKNQEYMVKVSVWENATNMKPIAVNKATSWFMVTQ